MVDRKCRYNKAGELVCEQKKVDVGVDEDDVDKFNGLEEFELEVSNKKGSNVGEDIEVV